MPTIAKSPVIVMQWGRLVVSHSVILDRMEGAVSVPVKISRELNLGVIDP